MNHTGSSEGQFQPQFPFEAAYQDLSGLAESMHYNGQLHQIIGELATADVRRQTSEYFWHTARLVRAAVDSKVDDRARVFLLQAVTDYAVGVYTGKPDLGHFVNVVDRLEDYGLTRKMVRQTYDPTTFEAQHPKRAAAAAERLQVHLGDRPLLIVPICHGGLLSAIEGGAYYNRLTGIEPTFYPVRYSRTKALDLGPRVRPEELKHLRDTAQERTVVVYDDDANTGRTVRRVVRYLAKNGVTGDGLLGVVNYDHRSARRQHRQGQWFD